MGFFIDDGFAITEDIPARPPLWDEPLTITWRPPTAGDGDKLREAVRLAGESEEAYGKVIRQFILERLTGWSAGREVTADAIALLHESLTEAIFRKVKCDKRSSRLTEGN